MTFDAQNPIVSSLVGETDIGKKDVFSKIITKAPNPIDFELKFQLDRLIARVGNKNNNNNNNFLPPPPPPPPPTNNLNFLLPPVFELPPLDDLFNLPGVLTTNLLRETKISKEKIILEDIQNKDWQYLVETLNFLCQKKKTTLEIFVE